MNSKKMFFVLMALWFAALSLFVAYKEYYRQDTDIVLLKITPVDSRDLYDKEGNLILTYDISKINPSQTFSSSKLPADGDTVYVSLVDNGRFVIGADIDSNPPMDRLFIKGTLKISKRLLGFRDSDISIVYGIETISISEEVKDTVNAAIEQGNAVIEAKIDIDGVAKIINFYADGKLINFTINQ